MENNFGLRESREHDEEMQSAGGISSNQRALSIRLIPFVFNPSAPRSVPSAPKITTHDSPASEKHTKGFH